MRDDPPAGRLASVSSACVYNPLVDWNHRDTLRLCEHVCAVGATQWEVLSEALRCPPALCALRWHALVLEHARSKSALKVPKYSDWELCVLMVACDTGVAQNMSKASIYQVMAGWLPGRTAAGLKQAYAASSASVGACMHPQVAAALKAHSWPSELTALMEAWPGPPEAVRPRSVAEDQELAASILTSLQEKSCAAASTSSGRRYSATAAAAAAATAASTPPPSPGVTSPARGPRGMRPACGAGQQMDTPVLLAAVPALAAPALLPLGAVAAATSAPQQQQQYGRPGSSANGVSRRVPMLQAPQPASSYAQQSMPQQVQHQAGEMLQGPTGWMQAPHWVPPSHPLLQQLMLQHAPQQAQPACLTSMAAVAPPALSAGMPPPCWPWLLEQHQVQIAMWPPQQQQQQQPQPHQQQASVQPQQQPGYHDAYNPPNWLQAAAQAVMGGAGSSSIVTSSAAAAAPAAEVRDEFDLPEEDTALRKMLEDHLDAALAAAAATTVGTDALHSSSPLSAQLQRNYNTRVDVGVTAALAAAIAAASAVTAGLQLDTPGQESGAGAAKRQRYGSPFAMLPPAAVVQPAGVLAGVPAVQEQQQPLGRTSSLPGGLVPGSNGLHPSAPGSVEACGYRSVSVSDQGDTMAGQSQAQGLLQQHAAAPQQQQQLLRPQEQPNPQLGVGQQPPTWELVDMLMQRVHVLEQQQQALQDELNKLRHQLGSTQLN